MKVLVKAYVIFTLDVPETDDPWDDETVDIIEANWLDDATFQSMVIEDVAVR